MSVTAPVPSDLFHLVCMVVLNALVLFKMPWFAAWKSRLESRVVIVIKCMEGILESSSVNLGCHRLSSTYYESGLEKHITSQWMLLEVNLRRSRYVHDHSWQFQEQNVEKQGLANQIWFHLTFSHLLSPSVTFCPLERFYMLQVAAAVYSLPQTSPGSAGWGLWKVLINRTDETRPQSKICTVYPSHNASQV